MSPLQLAVLMFALLTWGHFTLRIRKVFAHAKERSPGKSFLLISGAICTIAQLAACVLLQPAHPLLAVAGIAAYFVSNVMFQWSLSMHGKKRPAFAYIDVAPVTFQQRGPYRFVRHPIYTAYLLAWLAPVLVTGSLWLLFPCVWMWCIYFRAARQEERQFIQSSYSQEYNDYRRTTGMFFPRLLVSARG